MKYFTPTLAAVGLISCFGSGAFAQDTDFSKMTCADFAGMSSEEQSSAHTSLKEAHAMGATGSTDATTSGSGDTDTSASSDSGSTTAPSADAAAADTSAANGTVSADSTAPAADNEPNADVAALLAACEGNDDALAMEKVE